MAFDLPGRRVMRAAVIVTLMVALGLAGEASAQDRQRIAVEEENLDPLGRGLGSFLPRSGPPGTVVTLHGVEMPPLAPLRIGVGALRIGFEEVGWILSNEEGKFTFTVVIPGWARHDVAHFFIAFDPYFNPVRLSDVFHVTSPNGTVRRQGRIEDLGDRCPTLKGADRVPYVLVGDVSGFSVGADVVVEGTLAERSDCGERTAIEVVWIQAAG